MPNPHRLPRAAIPTRYDLTLTPDLDAASFTGQVDVELTIAEPIRELVCNAADLAIDAGHVLVRESDDTESLIAATWALDERAERLTIALAEPIGAGAVVTLHLEFTGVLNDKLRGFYRSTFTDG